MKHIKTALAIGFGYFALITYLVGLGAIATASALDSATTALTLSAVAFIASIALSIGKAKK